MEDYIKVLEQIARREVFLEVIMVILCAAVIFGIWGSFIYQTVKKKGKKRMTNRKKRLRKRSIAKAVAINCLATIITTLLAVIGITFIEWGQNDFKADIEQKSFETYQGEYSIETSRTGRRYNQFVILESGESIRLDRIKHFWLLDGEYEGTVVYAKHSNIVVYIDKDKPTD